MKSYGEFIIEAAGSSFKDKVKYSNEDWNNWKNLVFTEKPDLGKSFELHYDGPNKNIELIYKTDPAGHINHIATYDIKKEILYTDDTKLFGN